MNEKIEGAIAKTIQALSNASSTEDKTGILRGLTSYALKHGITKCVDCGAPITIRDRCPKHVGLAVGTDFFRDLAKEHGPRIVMNTMSKAQEIFEKWLGSEDTKQGEEEDFQPPKSST